MKEKLGNAIKRLPAKVKIFALLAVALFGSVTGYWLIDDFDPFLNGNASQSQPSQQKPSPNDPVKSADKQPDGNTSAEIVQGGGEDASLMVHFIDVGQADAVLIQCEGETLLIDGGNVPDGSLLVSYLTQQGITSLDYVVNTHPHEDHVGGLTGVLKKFSVETVFASHTEYDAPPFQNFAKAVRAQGGAITVPAAGDTFALGGASVSVIGPLKSYTAYEELNNASLVLRLTYKNISFLFTGDMERQAEKDLLDAGIVLESTVLKVGHHGSYSSTSYHFLREVNPDFAVISCEKGGQYGYPHDEPMSRLRDADLTLLRTDLQGHIVASSDGETVEFSVEKNPNIDTNPGDSGIGVYIGNRNSMLFHRTTCEGLPSQRNRVDFGSRQEAYEADYEPCPKCRP